MNGLRSANHAGAPHSRSYGDEWWTRLVAAVMVALAPAAALGLRNVSPGILLFVAALPVVLSRVWAIPETRRLLYVATAAVVAAPVMAWGSLSDQSRSLDADAALGVIRIFASGMAIFCILVWGRQVLGDRATALLFGAGVMVQGLMILNTSELNAWKYALAYPTAIVLLALVNGRQATFIALLSLAAVSAIFDYRSFIGICFLTLILYGWSERSRAKPRTVIRVLLVAAAFAAGVYKALGYLARHGHLGSSIQARTSDQVADGRSLIMGGRPEWAGAWELFRERPMGYGPGVTPNLSDMQSVKSGLADVGASTSGHYVEEFMLGRHIELHSVLSDLWVDFGAVGIAFAVLLVAVVLRGFAGRVSVGRLDGLTTLMVVTGIWYLGFSPRSGLVVVVCAAAFMVPARSAAGRPSAQVEGGGIPARQPATGALRATGPLPIGSP